eukprot:1937896-Pyramimonas_sp.AAC.1
MPCASLASRCAIKSLTASLQQFVTPFSSRLLVDGPSYGRSSSFSSSSSSPLSTASSSPSTSFSSAVRET